MQLRTRCLVLCIALSGCAEPVDPPADRSANTEPQSNDVTLEAAADLDANAEIAAAVPANDIWLLELEGSGARLKPGVPRNATRRVGYDNQPAFLPDSSGFLYSVIEDGQQSDVYRYDIARDASLRVSNTPESEYSPTPRADGSFTTVRVELDGTQRLWRLAADGAASLVLPDQRDVGYHAWLDEHRLALFIVGEPHRLVVADSRDGSVLEVAQDIGRGLAPIPGADAFSFVAKAADGNGELRRYDFASGQIGPLIATRGAAEDYCWTADGALLMAEGRQLYRLPAGADEWQEVANLGATLPGDITRLALSPDGRWLALVAAEGETQP